MDSPAIHVRIKPEDYYNLKVVAEYLGLTFSDVTRQCILAYLPGLMAQVLREKQETKASQAAEIALTLRKNLRLTDKMCDSIEQILAKQ